MELLRHRQIWLIELKVARSLLLRRFLYEWMTLLTADFILRAVVCCCLWEIYWRLPWWLLYSDPGAHLQPQKPQTGYLFAGTFLALSSWNCLCSVFLWRPGLQCLKHRVLDMDACWVNEFWVLSSIQATKNGCFPNQHCLRVAVLVSQSSVDCSGSPKVQSALSYRRIPPPGLHACIKGKVWCGERDIDLGLTTDWKVDFLSTKTMTIHLDLKTAQCQVKSLPWILVT